MSNLNDGILIVWVLAWHKPILNNTRKAKDYN